MDSNALSQSLEDYLEAIYEIALRKKAARAKDISDRLGVNRSSVTSALHTLADRNLVNYTPYDIITLTSEGERTAASISNRHAVLRDFLVDVLGVERDKADQSACGMEHAVSEEILDRLTRFVDWVRNCPEVQLRWDSTTREPCGRAPCLEQCEHYREQRREENGGESRQ